MKLKINVVSDDSPKWSVVGDIVSDFKVRSVKEWILFHCFKRRLTLSLHNSRNRNTIGRTMKYSIYYYYFLPNASRRCIDSTFILQSTQQGTLHNYKGRNNTPSKKTRHGISKFWDNLLRKSNFSIAICYKKHSNACPNNNVQANLKLAN